MKVLITGGGGQLAMALLESTPTGVTAVAPTKAELDVTDRDSMAVLVARQRPDVIINTAAYTAVDRAEQEPEMAFRVNASAPQYLATIARDIGARLVQISTDFVFDGAASSPYHPSSTPNPISTYGRSKNEGETAVVRELPTKQVLVLRTAWVYSRGGRNFLTTMLRLMKERPIVNVVGDQIGTPTAAVTLAQAIWRAIEIELCGIHHWTDAGTASWYDFAVAIYEEALPLGLVPPDVRIQQIRTVDYVTPAKRPPYSVLDKTDTWNALNVSPAHWRASLRQVLRHSVPSHAV